MLSSTHLSPPAPPTPANPTHQVEGACQSVCFLQFHDLLIVEQLSRVEGGVDPSQQGKGEDEWEEERRNRG